jgi:FlaA1/EpsC-like NDP-sugar epimerase
VGVYAWGLRNSDSDLQAQFNSLPSTSARVFVLLLNLIFAITFVASGMYTLKRGASRVDEAFKVAVAISLGLFIAYIVNALLPVLFSNTLDDLPLEQQILALSWAAAILATVLLRVLFRSFRYTLRRHGIDIRRVLIVGARDPGRLVYSTIRRVPQLGYRVQGFLSDSVPVGDLVDDLPVLGNPSALGRVIRATRADEVIIALSGRSSNDVLDIVALAEDESVEIKLYPDAFQLITNNEVSVGDISGLPLLSVKNVALDNPLNRALIFIYRPVINFVLAHRGPVIMAGVVTLIATWIPWTRIGSDGMNTTSSPSSVRCGARPMRRE